MTKPLSINNSSIVVLLILFLLGTFFPAISFAKDDNGPRILYTGSVRGAIVPIKG